MGKWWGWISCTFLALPLLSAPADLIRKEVSPGIRAALTSEYEIVAVVVPHQGDAWTRLAKRLTGDAGRWEEIAQLNGSDDNLRHGQVVRIPLTLLKPSLQREVVATLFPGDRTSSGGWKHVVHGGRGIEGESLWKIAEWFTGDGANYSKIRKANPNQGLSTRSGDVVLIPSKLLTAAFGGGMEEENASKAAAEVRKSENDPAQRSTEDEDVSSAAVEMAAARQPAALTYERNAADPYAVYRLQKGEALYSSVAIRFTGRVYAKDVGDVLERIVAFNGIEDVSKLRVGYSVKIPMDLLLPDYLPLDHPDRMADDRSKAASAQAAKRTRARGLSGVHVILDAGHGGRDVGTVHDDLYESDYVYDITARLKQLLEAKSGAKVSMTTRSRAVGYTPPARDVLVPANDHQVLTTPRYDLEDAIVGVNLRWYLANSIFRRAMKNGVTKEKVVFISVHADSLHPSLRGAMAYIPGERFVHGSYEKRGSIYLARAEVREKPTVRHSQEDALMAEGLSRGLAEAMVRSFTDANLKVHPFNPVRDNVVRGGREWVPAIIRHNVVPTRMLLEVGNLANRSDRKLIRTRRHRQAIAQAMYDGLVAFYAEQDAGTGAVVAAR